MKRLPTIGILIVTLLVVSGYVSSSPNEEPQVMLAGSAVRHLDPHLDYYEEHLIRMGIEQRRP